jgi:hypothetical protein
MQPMLEKGLLMARFQAVKPDAVTVSALRGALTGLVLATLVAGSLSLFSQLPPGFEADASPAFVDRSDMPTVDAGPEASRAYALRR